MLWESQKFDLFRGAVWTRAPQQHVFLFDLGEILLALQDGLVAVWAGNTTAARTRA